MNETDAFPPRSSHPADDPETAAEAVATESRHDEDDRLKPEYVFAVRDAVGAGDAERARELVSPLHPAGRDNRHSHSRADLGRGPQARSGSEVVPFGGDGVPMLAALGRDAIDGFMYVAPWPEEAIARNLGKIVINPTIGEVKEVAGVSILAFYGQEKWLDSKPDEVLASTRAIVKALRFIHQNPAATLEVLRKHVPDARPEVLQTAFNSYIKSVPKDPRISRDSMEKAVYFFNLGKPTDKQVKQSYEKGPPVHHGACLQVRVPRRKSRDSLAWPEAADTRLAPFPAGPLIAELHG